jgi:hypothetical protein
LIKLRPASSFSWQQCSHATLEPVLFMVYDCM